MRQSTRRPGIDLWTALLAGFSVALVVGMAGAVVWSERRTAEQRAACEATPGYVLVIGRHQKYCVLGEAR